ncbi:hypothetical protein EC951288_1284A, partial [Escherichia coli 95.1288]
MYVKLTYRRMKPIFFSSTV